MSLKLVAHPGENETVAEPATETIVLSEAQVEYLERISPELNPAFGWSHAIRTILDRFEQSGIDLTAASSEEEIARLAAAQLRSNAAPCASVSSRSAVRQEYQSNLPVTGRCRSGRPPR
jgi:hypothetical protein